MPTIRLEQEAELHDRALLLKVGSLRRRAASALGSLTTVDAHLEQELGFPVL